MELVKRVTACGHKGDLLCVERKPQSPVLATGSEAGTLSVVDTREWGVTAQLRTWTEPLASLAWHPGNEHVVYAASGCDVHEVDLRQMSAPGGGVCRSFTVGEEEANHVAVHPRGELLAAATDAGEIAIIQLGTGARQRTLRRVHTNIVSSVAWRPQRQADLLTTSLDATAVSWDVSNGSVRRSWVLRDAIQDVQLRKKPPLATSSDWSHLQMVNPPLGHSVAVGSQSHEERYAAVACGDGSVLMLLLDPRRSGGTAPPGRVSATKGGGSSSSQAWVLGREAGGHTYSASFVCFPSFRSDASQLVSCGNDGRILVWDYGPYVAGEAAQPQVVAHAQQKRKINWAATAAEPCARVYVAETSAKLACYELRG